MCSTCSSRLPIRYACRAAALLLAAPLLVRPAPAAAQQQDEALVSELARLLAAADARAFDPPLFREALQDPLPAVRRQAASPPGAAGTRRRPTSWSRHSPIRTRRCRRRLRTPSG